MTLNERHHFSGRTIAVPFRHFVSSLTFQCGSAQQIAHKHTNVECTLFVERAKSSKEFMCDVCMRDRCPLQCSWSGTQTEFQFTSIVNESVRLFHLASYTIFDQHPHSDVVGLQSPAVSYAVNRLRVSHYNFAGRFRLVPTLLEFPFGTCCVENRRLRSLQ